jgi:aminopeptidase-like protein
MGPRLGGARSDEGIEVFGGADGFHSQAALMGCRWQTFVARPDHPKGEPQLGRRGLYGGGQREASSD